jgi:peptidoglycan hydrolase-like amidase
MWGYDAYMQAVQDSLLPPRSSPLPPDALFRWIRDAPETYSNVPAFNFPNTYRWERWISPDEIRRRLMDDNRVAQDPGEIHRIITRGRGLSGRIIELEVQGSEGSVFVRGNAIWATMGGLRSNLFTIRYKLAPDGVIQYFVFSGAGYGHGVGMDQHAAGAKAGSGMSAEEILFHFYPRASLRQLDDSVFWRTALPQETAYTNTR